MQCTYPIEETKGPCLSLYSDSMGFNIGRRPSLYSDKHGGVKVKNVKKSFYGFSAVFFVLGEGEPVLYSLTTRFRHCGHGNIIFRVLQKNG